MRSTRSNQEERHSLGRDLWTTTILEAVVPAIAGIAAGEVDGIDPSQGGTRLPGDSSPTVGERFDNFTGGGSRTRGLSVMR